MASTHVHSMAEKPHILVVDDDDRLRRLLGRYLAEQDFLVSVVSSAGEARERLKAFEYDLIVLDVMMPGETGLEFLTSLRRTDLTKENRIPVLMLTARGGVQERIEGLETGADDYLTKPFEPKELLLRINAILLRMPKKIEKRKIFHFGPWVYDPVRGELKSKTEIQSLTEMENGLLRLLADSAGSAVSRAVLAERSKADISERTIDVQVIRLRRRLEEDAKKPRYLLTVRGEGYLLRPDKVVEVEE